MTAARQAMTERLVRSCGFAPDWGLALSGAWWRAGEELLWGLSHSEDCDRPLDPRELQLTAYERGSDGEWNFDAPVHCHFGTLREVLEVLDTYLPDAVPVAVMGLTANLPRHVARRSNEIWWAR